MSQKIFAVVGLGYVGLPLAVDFGKKSATGGYDLSEREVVNYLDCRDPSGDVLAKSFRAANRRSSYLNVRLIKRIAAAIVAQEYATH